MIQTEHQILDCGVELAVAPMPDKRVVALGIRLLSGVAHDPPEKLGLARLIKETIDKGTARYDGRALLDAFDELGASIGSWAGREATGFSCVCLPEYLDRALELHAEFIRQPTFPAEAVQTAVVLAQQELAALEDDPAALVDKYIEWQGFGPVLGRHPLGDPHMLSGIGPGDLLDHWRRTYAAAQMQISVAGPVEPLAMGQMMDRYFGGFGDNHTTPRQPFELTFEPQRTHHSKDLEQQQIAICFPSAAPTDADFPAERLLLGVLAGGMSARLFTEVREKKGLAYDVHASAENPRGLGMIFVSASCKPDRAQLTFDTLLHEIDRLSQDLTEDELERARTRLIVREETLADMTRSRRSALAYDLFHHGRPRSTAERVDLLKKVTAADLVTYLRDHPRDRLSIVTLGPCELAHA